MQSVTDSLVIADRFGCSASFLRIAHSREVLLIYSARERRGNCAKTGESNFGLNVCVLALAEWCLSECPPVPFGMEKGSTNEMAKRMKPSIEEKEIRVECGSAAEVAREENEPSTSNSEQLGLEIAHILEKINNFTQMVSELLESGKSMLKELSNEFEERMILIHKEQMERWQDEIKELRMLDAANEETDALLQNAKCLLQNIHGGS